MKHNHKTTRDIGIKLLYKTTTPGSNFIVRKPKIIKSTINPEIVKKLLHKCEQGYLQASILKMEKKLKICKKIILPHSKFFNLVVKNL